MTHLPPLLMYRIEKQKIDRPFKENVYVTLALSNGKCYGKYLKTIKEIVYQKDLICNWGRIESWDLLDLEIQEWIKKRIEDGFRLKVLNANVVYDEELDIPWSNHYVPIANSLSRNGKPLGRPVKKLWWESGK